MNANASSPDAAVLDSKSTATAVQRQKVLLLLRQGPKTTLQLREHGILMPATRVFELKNHDGIDIQSELVALFDTHGYPHKKVARYHLSPETPTQSELFAGGDDA